MLLPVFPQKSRNRLLSQPASRSIISAMRHPGGRSAHPGSWLGLVAPSPSFSLAPLGPVFFLGTDESQTAPVLTNDPRTLNSLSKTSQQLIKRF
jgi:hypothetical protein